MLPTQLSSNFLFSILIVSEASGFVMALTNPLFSLDWFCLPCGRSEAHSDCIGRGYMTGHKSIPGARIQQVESVITSPIGPLANSNNHCVWAEPGHKKFHGSGAHRWPIDPIIMKSAGVPASLEVFLGVTSPCPHPSFQGALTKGRPWRTWEISQTWLMSKLSSLNGKATPLITTPSMEG